jgi:antitoxin component of MazEF toxin-antitoxin module
MKTQTLKIVQIGNSRGVRLPATWISRYHLGDHVVAEAHPEGLWLRPASDERALSWEATAQAMAAENRTQGNEFADLDVAATDGLDSLDR